MKKIWALVLLTCMGSLALVGCENSASPTSQESSQTLGSVAFRLTSQDSLALAGTVDSVRIQATREGFATHSASGSVHGITSLADLETGSWRLEVALYDSARMLRWYGDTSVTVVAGLATDIVVRLTPAKGSVNVRIGLDSSTAVLWQDTLLVGPTNWGNQATWSPTKSWRTAEGIFLEHHPLYCGIVPKVRIASTTRTCEAGTNYCGTFLPIADSSGLVLETEDKSAVTACLAIAYSPETRVRHFVPWTRKGDVTLHTAAGPVILQEP